MWAADAIGYLASAAVLATFCMRDMAALRATAIASNAAFIAYGALAGVHPVLLLHVALLPINVCRLIESLRARPTAPPAARRGETPVAESTPQTTMRYRAAASTPPALRERRAPYTVNNGPWTSASTTCSIARHISPLRRS